MRRIVDICMTLVLLVLMAYQVTGQTVHEWTGILMTVLVITHQVLVFWAFIGDRAAVFSRKKAQGGTL